MNRDLVKCTMVRGGCSCAQVRFLRRPRRSTENGRRFSETSHLSRDFRFSNKTMEFLQQGPLELPNAHPKRQERLEEEDIHRSERERETKGTKRTPETTRKRIFRLTHA